MIDWPRPSPISDPPRPTRGTNQTGMRARNERLVLTLIRRHGALAKAEIARLTGLSAQTVSVIMRRLETDGLLLKGDPRRGKVGQPSVPMRLNPDGAFFLGLKVGRRSAEMVLTDFLGHLRARRTCVFPYPDFDRVYAFALDAADSLRRQMPAHQRARIAGLGVALPFQIWQWPHLIGAPPETMTAWQRRDLRQDLSRALDLEVSVENDASSACAAELVLGSGARPSNYLYVFVGFFIGGGVVLDGRLYTGPSGNAGAIGSMPIVDLNGQRCQLIERGSLMDLERRLDHAGLDSTGLWMGPEGWTLPQDLVETWVAEAGNGIAQAAHSALAVIDFEAVMIDGWMPENLRTALVDEVRKSFECLDFTGLESPPVIPGSIGPDARSLGAASQPLIARFLSGYGA